MNIPVQNKKELLDRILTHRIEIESYGVRRLGIFGSFAKDTVKETSDVDFFIEFDPKFKTLGNFVKLTAFFQNILGRRSEIVTPQALNKFIGKYILQEVEYVSFAA